MQKQPIVRRILSIFGFPWRLIVRTEEGYAIGRVLIGAVFAAMTWGVETWEATGIPLAVMIFLVLGVFCFSVVLLTRIHEHLVHYSARHALSLSGVSLFDVDVRNEATGEANITLQYFMHNASWVPIYCKMKAAHVELEGKTSSQIVDDMHEGVLLPRTRSSFIFKPIKGILPNNTLQGRCKLTFAFGKNKDSLDQTLIQDMNIHILHINGKTQSDTAIISREYA